MDPAEVLQHHRLLNEKHSLQIAVLTDHILLLSEAQELQQIHAFNMRADELVNLLVLQFELVVLGVQWVLQQVLQYLMEHL